MSRPTLHLMHEGPTHDEDGHERPIVVLSHALGADLHLWDRLVPLLTPTMHVVRYDHRGHGHSAPADGPYPIEALADDLAGLIERECPGRRVHAVGLSMGGMTVQSLAARRPELLASLTIANSAAHFADPSSFAARVALVRREGVAAVADAAIERWLTASFRKTPAGAAAAAALHRTLCANDARQYAWASEAVAGIDLRDGHRRTSCPTLVIAGAHDTGTPPALSAAIAEAIAGARLVTLATAHLSAVERPDEFAAALRALIATAPERQGPA